MGQAVAFIPAALTIVGGLMGKAGADQSADGSEAAGEGARRAGLRTAEAKRFEAAQLRINAGQEIAAGQAASHEQERQAQLVASRQLALAAASGAGATAPTIVKLISDTAKESSYRAALSVYQGEDRARALRMQASGKEYEAIAALEAGEDAAAAYGTKAKAYKTAGITSLFQAGASLFGKYGMGGAKAGAGDSATVAAGSDASWLDVGTDFSGVA